MSFCLSPGACIDAVNGFTCSCLTGYTGVRCEQEINECIPSPCQQGAECLNLIGQFECVCPPGFEGALLHSYIL